MRSLREGPTLRIGGVSLTVMEEVHIDSFHDRGVLVLQARKLPHSVVVRDGATHYRLSMDGGKQEAERGP